MFNLDSWIRKLFQRFYDILLDECGVRIGSFRMAAAVAPFAVDVSLRIAAGERPATLAFSAFLVGVLMTYFYSRRAMRVDNRLQAMGHLATLNTTSSIFEARTFRLRIFYLILFTASSLVLHNFDGFALLDIVFARCVKVRPRRPRDRHKSMAPSLAHA